MCAVDDKRRQVLHATQAKGLLDWGEELSHGEVIDASRRVAGLAAPDRDRAHRLLAQKRVASGSIGPSVLEDEIYPLLEERGRAVPVERMLQDEDLVGDEKLLLTLDIYVEVRDSSRRDR